MKKKRKFLSFLFISFSWARRAVLLRWERSRTVFSKKERKRSASIHAFSVLAFDGIVAFCFIDLSGVVKLHEAQSIVSLPVHGAQHTHSNYQSFALFWARRAKRARDCMWINKKKSWKVIASCRARNKQQKCLFIVRAEEWEKKKVVQKIIDFSKWRWTRAPFSIEKFKNKKIAASARERDEKHAAESRWVWLRRLWSASLPKKVFLMIVDSTPESWTATVTKLQSPTYTPSCALAV